MNNVERIKVFIRAMMPLNEKEIYAEWQSILNEETMKFVIEV
jgi:hypothetical protein